jgi:secondary thiamine-phosphate synthase enzyme
MRSKSFRVKTSTKVEIRLITREVEAAIRDLEVSEGLVMVLVPHTTAAVSINENADPDVRRDLERAFAAIVPDVRFDHGEGNSDAHLLSTIVGASLTVPWRGRLQLGTWQGIYFLEFDGPRSREVQVWVQ